MLNSTTQPGTANCLPASILTEVATGRIPEPLLGIYLEHLESCDICCNRIAAEATGPLPSAAHAATAQDQPELDHWLARLKQDLRQVATQAEPATGSTIGPFRIMQVLGTGGSSIVYEALDEHLGRTVVLKVLRAPPADASEQHRLVVAEARALAAVQHDAIMPLLQLLWHDGTPVLVFPRLAGETLADALATGGISTRHALTIARDVARGLAHVHGLGIFHRDLKPSNIWLQRLADGRVSARIFDFGLAGTATVVAGTPGYAAPETVAGAQLEPHDLFSLGVVLHECLTHVPTAPPRCRDLVRRLTAAAPSTRPRAAAVAAEIDQLLAQRPSAGRRATAIAALAGCLALAGLVILVGPLAGPVVSEAQAGLLGPDAVIPGVGLPIAISGDGLSRCVVADGPVLRIDPISGGGAMTRVPLAFKPDRLAFNEHATRLAAADALGNLAIIDVPSATVTLTHRFADGVAWLGWSGWNRDAVVVLSGHVVHAFFKTRRGTPELDPPPEWLEDRMREDVREIATLPGTEAVLSMDHSGQLTMWSVGRLTEDMPVRLSLIHASQPKEPFIIGWKSRGVGFVAEDRRLTEFAPYHGIESFRLPAPAKAVAWPDESMLVVLTDEPGGRSRLLLTHRSRPDWSREFDLGGATITSISLLADHNRIAAIASDGSVRLYSLPDRP